MGKQESMRTKHPLSNLECEFMVWTDPPDATRPHYNGRITMAVYMGLVSAHIYPTAAEARELARILIAAADETGGT